MDYTVALLSGRRCFIGTTSSYQVVSTVVCLLACFLVSQYVRCSPDVGRTDMAYTVQTNNADNTSLIISDQPNNNND